MGVALMKKIFFCLVLLISACSFKIPVQEENLCQALYPNSSSKQEGCGLRVEAMTHARNTLGIYSTLLAEARGGDIEAMLLLQDLKRSVWRRIHRSICKNNPRFCNDI
jgi:hypothetical protein